MDGLLGQIRTDFEYICSADFSESVTITDGIATVVLKVLFDEAVQHFEPDTQGRVLYAGSRFAVAETATDFNLRRAGLLVTARGKTYKVRQSDWEYDGIGQLLVYLESCAPTETPTVADPPAKQMASLTLANLIPGTTNIFRLPTTPRSSTLRIYVRGQRLSPDQFTDNRDGTFTITDPNFLPIGAEGFVADYADF